MPRNESETTKKTRASTALIKAYAAHETLLKRRAELDEKLDESRANLERLQAKCHELGVPLKYE